MPVSGSAVGTGPFLQALLGAFQTALPTAISAVVSAGGTGLTGNTITTIQTAHMEVRSDLENVKTLPFLCIYADSVDTENKASPFTDHLLDLRFVVVCRSPLSNASGADDLAHLYCLALREAFDQCLPYGVSGFQAYWAQVDGYGIERPEGGDRWRRHAILRARTRVRSARS